MFLLRFFFYLLIRSEVFSLRPTLKNFQILKSELDFFEIFSMLFEKKHCGPVDHDIVELHIRKPDGTRTMVSSERAVYNLMDNYINYCILMHEESVL